MSTRPNRVTIQTPQSYTTITTTPTNKPYSTSNRELYQIIETEAQARGRLNEFHELFGATFEEWEAKP